MNCKPSFSAYVLTLAVFILAGVLTYVLIQNKNKKVDNSTATPVAKLQAKQTAPAKLEVLNCVFERPQEPGTFEHVIYFSLQESADFFRFFINEHLIGQGSFEDLDVRYSPPYRRVVFVTTEPPILPMAVRVESLSKNRLVGQGSLYMEKLCYHNKP